MKLPQEFIIIDIETTGFNPQSDHILEIAAIKIKDNQITDVFCELINPNVLIPPFITSLTGICNNLVKNAKKLDEVLNNFLLFISNQVLMGHNIRFDMSFLKLKIYNNLGINIVNQTLDTILIAKRSKHNFVNHKLQTLAKHFNIEQNKAHRALDDCYTTYFVYKKLIEE